jgi:hypothetical protein
MIKTFLLGFFIALVIADNPMQQFNTLNDIFSGSLFGRSVFGNQDDDEYELRNVKSKSKPDIIGQMKHMFKIIVKPDSYKKSKVDKFRKFSAEGPPEELHKHIKIFEEQEELDTLHSLIQ